MIRTSTVYSEHTAKNVDSHIYHVLEPMAEAFF